MVQWTKLLQNRRFLYRPIEYRLLEKIEALALGEPGLMAAR